MAAERPRKLMTPISCQSPVSPSRQLVSAKLSSPSYRPSTRLVIARSLGFLSFTSPLGTAGTGTLEQECESLSYPL